jgi:hypothetical protein
MKPRLQKFNIVQKKLLNLGYPRSIIREYEVGSTYFREEIQNGRSNSGKNKKAVPSPVCV